MIQVVTAHGLDHRLKGHLAAFRMAEFFREIRRCNGFEEGRVPTPGRDENGQSGMRVKHRIGFRPQVLIERLDDVILLRQSLPQAIREHKFAIGKMAQDLASPPFSGRQAALHSFRTKLVDQ